MNSRTTKFIFTESRGGKRRLIQGFHAVFIGFLPVLPPLASSRAWDKERGMNTRTHGILDYIVGILLIATPWLFGFAQDRAETWIPVLLGAGALLYSLLTDYEFGVWRIIPMRTHLALDVASGLFLAASPWLFDFADLVYWPHLAFGIFEIAAAAMTQRAPRRAPTV